MIRHFFNYFGKVTRAIAFLILVMGIVGLGAAEAAQLVCAPDCSMHQETRSSCCDVSETEPAKMRAPQSIGKDQQTADPCCEGKFCFDSAIDLQTIATSSNVAPDLPVAAPDRLLSALTTVSISPKKLSFKPCHPEEKIPIYMRTCVFLI